jgi:hypothetical protein
MGLESFVLREESSHYLEPVVIFPFVSHTPFFCLRNRSIMKFSLALAAVLSAVASANKFAPAKSSNNGKSAFVSKLMRGAKVTANSQLRKLDEDEEEYVVDISGYSVKFEKCQFVKAYDDELAEDEDSATVLGTKRFVVFRLCPDNSCSTCNYNYGEYMIDLETYLEATVEFQQEVQEEMCEACEQCGNWDDQQAADENNQDNGERKLQNYSVDCDSCYDECIKIENMEENGYIDATEFLECQMIYDPEDDGKTALYAGPMCASQGAKIKIGVFTDEYCNMLDSSKDVDDYLMDGDGYQMKLSHALLKTVYAEENCVSCLVVEEEEEQEDGDERKLDEADEPQVLEMCETLYEAGAKCEKTHGFDSGYADYSGYANQLSQEAVVCDFIDSIKAGSYDEQGEIVVNGGNGSSGGGAKTTGGQKFALTFFTLGTVGLSVYAAMLHSKLTKGGANLANQGGAMA